MRKCNSEKIVLQKKKQKRKMLIRNIIILWLLQLSDFGFVSSFESCDYRGIQCTFDLVDSIAGPFRSRITGNINKRLGILKSVCGDVFSRLNAYHVDLPSQMEMFDSTVENISDETIRSYYTTILTDDSKSVSNSINIVRNFSKTDTRDLEDQTWKAFRHEPLDGKKTNSLNLDEKDLLEYIKSYLDDNVICGDSISLQQIVYETYAMLISTEISRFFVTMFANKLTNIFLNAPMDKDIDNIIAATKQRLNTIADNFESRIKRMPRYIRHCDPASQEEVDKYVGTMGDLFQIMLFREIDYDAKSCPGSCPHIDVRDNRKNFDCDNDIGEKNYCPQRKPCFGRIYNCEPMVPSDVCLGDTSRYKWFKNQISHEKYGPSGVSCDRENIFRYEGAKSVSGCGICRCVCVNSNPLLIIKDDGTILNPVPESSIFKIDLRWKRSSTEKNSVITGVSLNVECSMLSLQIEENVIERGMKLNPSVINRHLPCRNDAYLREYFEEDKPTLNREDYAVITEDEFNAINLDDIIVQHGRVITGVRFGISNKMEIPRRIELQVESMEYNREADELMHFSKLHSSSFKHNTDEIKLNLAEYDIPTREFEESNSISTEGSFVRFTLSSYEKDAGQSVVPFIEQRNFSEHPRSPIAGVGIYHKRSSSNAGYLAIRLFSLDYAEMMIKANSEGNELDEDEDEER